MASPANPTREPFMLIKVAHRTPSARACSSTYRPHGGRDGEGDGEGGAAGVLAVCLAARAPRSDKRTLGKTVTRRSFIVGAALD